MRATVSIFNVANLFENLYKINDGPAQIFVTFSRGAFLVNKGVFFFQTANDLNIELELLFLVVYLVLYIVYSVFLVLY